MESVAFEMNPWLEDRVIVLEDGCWEWLGATNNKGYGKLRKRGKDWLAHRYVYHTFVARIEDGYVVRHKCNYTYCVNPNHLHTGTPQDNVHDQIERGTLIPPKGKCKPIEWYRQRS